MYPTLYCKDTLDKSFATLKKNRGSHLGRHLRKLNCMVLQQLVRKVVYQEIAVNLKNPTEYNLLIKMVHLQ